MTDLDRVKERIRKLLNLANNDAAMGLEVDNALKFARRLMLEHNVSESDVLQKPRDPHEVAAATEYAQVKFQTEYQGLSVWENYLLHAIVKLIGTIGSYTGGPETKRTSVGTIMYNEEGKPKKCRGVAFYGPSEDCMDALGLFQEWRETIVALARMKHGTAFMGPGRSYAEGFAMALYQKVQNIEKEEQKQLAAVGTTSSLVLRSQTALMFAKQKFGSQWLRGQGVKLHKAEANKQTDVKHYAGAMHEGMKDGKSMDFSRESKPRLGGG